MVCGEVLCGVVKCEKLNVVVCWQCNEESGLES